MARLAERKEQALHAGSEEAVQRQHDRGKMTARERIDHVLDEGRSRSSTCWPAGPSEAVEIVHRRELAEAAGPAARRAEFIEAYTERHANPYEAAERGPSMTSSTRPTTRRVLVRSRAFLHTKREEFPKRKHGNMPL